MPVAGDMGSVLGGFGRGGGRLIRGGGRLDGEGCLRGRGGGEAPCARHSSANASSLTKAIKMLKCVPC